MLQLQVPGLEEYEHNQEGSSPVVSIETAGFCYTNSQKMRGVEKRARIVLKYKLFMQILKSC